MARPELGTKHTCTSCEAKFYDLNRTPIKCPNCGEDYTAAPVTPVVAKRTKPMAKAKPVDIPAVKEVVAEPVADDTDDTDEVEIDEELLADAGIEDDDDAQTDDTGVLIVDADEDNQSVTSIVSGGKPDKEST